jgi:hypothetical protein
MGCPALVFFFTRVGTYVQRGSKFCFVVVVVVVVLLLVVGESLIKILLYLPICSISPCFRHCSKYCIIILFHHAFSSLARQPCPAGLPGSLARQPCPAVRSISTGFDAGARSAVTALYYSGRSPNCIRALLS